MQLNSLKPNTKKKRAIRVGRGGKRGKTSGKGHKGQKARAGHKIRPNERDIIKRLPKLRGHGKNRSHTVNTGRVKAVVVNLSSIEAAFTAGDAINPKTLVAKKIVAKESGRYPSVKILGNGSITKNVTVSNCTLSQSAKEAIEKAGGSILTA